MMTQKNEKTEEKTIDSSEAKNTKKQTAESSKTKKTEEQAADSPEKKKIEEKTAASSEKANGNGGNGYEAKRIKKEKNYKIELCEIINISKDCNNEETENKCLSSKKKKQMNYIPKVFISYSRDHDHVIAGLLAHALKKEGLNVLYDRRLKAGFNVVNNISQYITDSHAVILILSNNSVNSAWVNQEVGFARALDKPIIPIQVDSAGLQPVGMLSEINPLEFNLTDWFNSNISIDKLKEIIYTAVDEKETRVSVISTKEERTQKIIDEFKSLIHLLDKNKCPDNRQKIKLKLYKRTSFSIFSVRKPLKEVSHRYNDKYWELLREQRRTIEAFIMHPDVTEVRLHLCPKGSEYDDRIREIRYKNLIHFIDQYKDNEIIAKKIKIKLERHGQSNIIAVDDHFVFEGLRPKSESEYMYTLHWSYPSSKIKKYFNSFDRNWVPLSEYDNINNKLKNQCKADKNGDCNYGCLTEVDDIIEIGPYKKQFSTLLISCPTFSKTNT